VRLWLNAAAVLPHAESNGRQRKSVLPLSPSLRPNMQVISTSLTAAASTQSSKLVGTPRQAVCWYSTTIRKPSARQSIRFQSRWSPSDCVERKSPEKRRPSSSHGDNRKITFADAPFKDLAPRAAWRSNHPMKRRISVFSISIVRYEGIKKFAGLFAHRGPAVESPMRILGGAWRRCREQWGLVHHRW
jgi:hypothetical protein